MRSWADDLTPEERDLAIERFASGVVRRRMETPAILFLEMHRPLSFVASQALVVASPFVAPLVGLENVQVAARLLEDRDNVERLISRIEELSLAARDRGAEA